MLGILNLVIRTQCATFENFSCGLGRFHQHQVSGLADENVESWLLDLVIFLLRSVVGRILL